MHGNHGRCGGFVVHETLDEALGAFRAKDHEGIAPLIAYTIDNAATVDGLLPQLSATSLLGYIQSLVSFGTRVLHLGRRRPGLELGPRHVERLRGGGRPDRRHRPAVRDRLDA